MKSNNFQQRQIKVDSKSFHLVEMGNKEKQAILFLHGYPENWSAFEKVMDELRNDYHLLTIDLPGIGLSEKIGKSDKKTIAKFINAIIEHLGLSNVILAGHDIGGMIA